MIFLDHESLKLRLRAHAEKLRLRAHAEKVEHKTFSNFPVVYHLSYLGCPKKTSVSDSFNFDLDPR